VKKSRSQYLYGIVLFALGTDVRKGDSAFLAADGTGELFGDVVNG
jgi:hypothetical protein